MRAQVCPVPESRILHEARTIPLPLSLPFSRVANIDRLRILAAIGIVWFHTEGAPHRQVAYAGLPVFLLIFFSLLTARGSSNTTGEFVRRRYDRLLKPWLFWSVVYGACRLAKVVSTTDTGELWEMFSLQTLLAGTSIHLWYLPYAFVSGLLIHEFNRWTARADHVVVTSAAMAAGAVILIIHAIGLCGRGLTYPLPQWEFGLAAIPLGVATGRCLLIPSRNRRKLLLTTISLLAVIECQALSMLGFGLTVLPYGIGVALVCLAYYLEIRPDIVSASLAPLTFGVYLIHPLVAYALRGTLASDGHGVLFALLTVCLSALAVLVLMRTPIRRFV